MKVAISAPKLLGRLSRRHEHVWNQISFSSFVAVSDSKAAAIVIKIPRDFYGLDEFSHCFIDAKYGEIFILKKLCVCAVIKFCSWCYFDSCMLEWGMELMVCFVG
jgi:hypothetical protein